MVCEYDIFLPGGVVVKKCEECGAELGEWQPGTSKRFCTDCIRKHKRDAARRRVAAMRTIREMEKLVKPVKTIAEIQREAQAAGMSYGQYVASLRR